ncbi:MAG: GatB/YqeY domain-containing protein [Candidatus Margulisbacteria bacterium]|nr:GatB/YqeY domain-containing protein [Candidatus Margulisiibacteriota bacterium]MBU1616359.1 GatB/YqeY domain-containing protein [Candidatus Margulisiibacteriota bacterium]MBU1867111.1 GatB/YqeY domain-containing protein [Candidatus Margulisiibacteriota bacterium]
MVFGNLGKMAEMVKQANEIKKEMQRARYDGESGGVKIVVNGEMELLEIRIPPELAHNKIEQAVKEAVNKTMHTAKQDMAKRMSKMTGGLSLPGM